MILKRWKKTNPSFLQRREALKIIKSNLDRQLNDVKLHLEQLTTWIPTRTSRIHPLSHVWRTSTTWPAAMTPNLTISRIETFKTSSPTSRTSETRTGGLSCWRSWTRRSRRRFL